MMIVDDEIETGLRRGFAAEQTTAEEALALSRLRRSVSTHEFAGSPGHDGRRLAVALLAVAATAAVSVAAILSIHPNRSQSATTPPPAVASPTPAVTSATPASPTPAVTSATPAPPSPSPTPIPGIAAAAIDQVRMTDASHGWAVDHLPSRQRVLRTDDGGLSWHDVSPPVLQQPGLSGATAAIAAASGSESAWVVVPGTGLYRTADGGRSWTVSSGRFSSAQLQFTGSSTGYAFVDKGHAAGSEAVEIWKTVDGGSTWTLVSATGTAGSGDTGVPFMCSKNGAGWRDDLTAWATGACAGPPAVFLVTHDGGVHWATQALPMPPGASADGGGFTTNPPVFSTPRDGTMIANSAASTPPTAFIYSTHDGGSTWTYQAAPANTGQVSVVAGASIAVTADGTLVRSSDGGRQWTLMGRHPELQTSTLTSLQFVDADHGFFVAGNGTLYVTKDGGRTLVRR